MPVIDELKGAYSFISAQKNTLWFYTTENAPNGKIVKLEINKDRRDPPEFDKPWIIPVKHKNIDLVFLFKFKKYLFWFIANKDKNITKATKYFISINSLKNFKINKPTNIDGKHIKKKRFFVS